MLWTVDCLEFGSPARPRSTSTDCTVRLHSHAALHASTPQSPPPPALPLAGLQLELGPAQPSTPPIHARVRIAATRPQSISFRSILSPSFFLFCTLCRYAFRWRKNLSTPCSSFPAHRLRCLRMDGLVYDLLSLLAVPHPQCPPGAYTRWGSLPCAD